MPELMQDSQNSNKFICGHYSSFVHCRLPKIRTNFWNSMKSQLKKNEKKNCHNFSKELSTWNCGLQIRFSKEQNKNDWLWRIAWYSNCSTDVDKYCCFAGLSLYFPTDQSSLRKRNELME
jgi:hypothetical protein